MVTIQLKNTETEKKQKQCLKDKNILIYQFLHVKQLAKYFH